MKLRPAFPGSGGVTHLVAASRFASKTRTLVPSVLDTYIPLLVEMRSRLTSESSLDK